MKGKSLAIGLLVALFSVVGLVFWLGMTGQREENERPGTGGPSAAPAAASAVNVDDGGGRD